MMAKFHLYHQFAGKEYRNLEPKISKGSEGSCQDEISVSKFPKGLQSKKILVN